MVSENRGHFFVSKKLFISKIVGGINDLSIYIGQEIPYTMGICQIEL